MPHPRALPLDFRQREVRQIYRCMLAGESCQVVGVSGTGKSNLFRHLSDPDAQRHYHDKADLKLLIIPVDLHQALDYSIEQLFITITNAIWAELQKSEIDPDRLARIQQELHPDQEIQDRLAGVIRQTIADLETSVVLLLDQFDEIYQTVDPMFFRLLRYLRDMNKYELSYVVFSRDHLEALMRDKAHEEFLELISATTVYLQPHPVSDARVVGQRVIDRNGFSISQVDLARLIEVSGGHAGLLRALVMSLGRSETALPLDDDAMLAHIFSYDAVQTECLKLWECLNPAEQSALRQAVVEPQQADVPPSLRNKGVVSDQPPSASIFSPLFARFVAEMRQRSVPAPDSQSAYADRAGPDIQVNELMGRAWCDGVELALSPLEFKLLALMNKEPGALFYRNDLARALYDHDELDWDSDTGRLDNIVRRLRAKLGDTGQSSIETVRGRGYRLVKKSP